MRSKPRFPSSMKSNSLKSFVKFRENQLAYVLPKATLESMDLGAKKKFFDSMWTGRRIKHFDHRVEKGEVKYKTFTKKMPKGRLSDMNGKIRPEVREALLIKPSSTCRLIGTVPFVHGSAPAKCRGVDTRFYKFFRDTEPHIRKLYEPEYHDRVSVPGVWETQWIDIQKAGDETQHEMTYKKMFDAIERRFTGNLQLPVLAAPDLDSIDLVETNPRAQPGLLSKMWFGPRHEVADKYIRPLAKNLFTTTGDRTCSDTGCWQLGGRARRQKLSVDKPLRGRIIMMPEGPQKMLSLAYASPLYKKLGQINFGNHTNECQIGRNDFHGNYPKYEQYFKSLGLNTFECDISQHDASTNEETMVVAFGIIRSCFPDGADIDRRFLYMMSGTIFKNLVVPGRFIYKLLKSIPSGSPFTSILTTIVNWLNWSVVLNEEFAEKSNDFKMNLFGDDTIINIPDDIDVFDKYKSEWWTKTFKETCGYDLDPAEMRSFFDPDWRNRPSFLKTIPNNGLPARLEKDTIMSSSMVKPSRSSWMSYATIASGLAYAAPFNFEGLEYIFALRSWLYNNSPEVDCPYFIMKKEASRRTSENNITYNLFSRSYLIPLVYGYEYIKNVDLGNKPKQVSFGKRWLEDDVPSGFKVFSTNV
jgi:hypothetical protein